jgi:hypothetical protein
MQIRGAEFAGHLVMDMPAPATTQFELPGWPTLMTTPWYRGMESQTTPRAVTTAPGAPEYPLTHVSSTTSQAAFFGATMTATASRRATFYIDQDNFSHNCGRVAFHVDLSEATAQLVNMRHRLQLRWSIVEQNKQDLSLDAMIYRRGPLYLEGNTMAGTLLGISEDLLQIFSSLLHHRHQTSSPYSEQVLTNLIQMAIGVYCQLLAFFELLLELLTARIERIFEPMIAVPGMTLDGVPVHGLSAQGALCANTCITTLERFDGVLGLASERTGGLLSATQINLLWDTLDGGPGLVSSDAIMRPAELRKVYSQARAVLGKISLMAS